MPSATVVGTRLAVMRCDLHRIAAGGPVGITSADGARRARCTADSAAVFDLLTGRYLHSASATSEHPSRMVVGNEPRPLSNSKVWLSFALSLAGPGAGPRSGVRGSNCPTVILEDDGCAAIGDMNVALGPGAHRPEGQMTKLSTTLGVERCSQNAVSRLTADIGVAEVHDSSTPANKISYEVSAVTTLEGPVADGR